MSAAATKIVLELQFLEIEGFTEVHTYSCYQVTSKTSVSDSIT